MKVAIINRSDAQGGAAVTSLRLTHALQQQGVDARLLVIDGSTGDPAVTRVGGKWACKSRFLAERLDIFLRNGLKRDTLFAIDTGRYGLDLSKHPWVQQADVVVLNWVNQAMLSLEGVERIYWAGKPIVWIMHDMWNCTGVCHHAQECEGYKSVCRNCYLLPGKGDDLSTTVQRNKQELYSRVPIHFVAVSNWLAGCCRASAIMRDASLSVIHNAFPVEQFDWHETRGGEGLTDIDPARKVLIMGARRLDEEIKGFDLFIAAMRYIADSRPALAQRLHIILYGDLRDHSLLEQIPIPLTYLGTVTSSERINELYRHSDVVVSTSRFENLPGTLIEGQASGCLPVTYGRGGQADIVDHLKSGFIAEFPSPASLADGISWAIDAGVDRAWLHGEVVRKFSSATIARQHIELYQRIIAEREK